MEWTNLQELKDLYYDADDFEGISLIEEDPMEEEEESKELKKSLMPQGMQLLCRILIA